MKTAVSIPEDVFRQGDRLARRLKLSRSALYATAVREFVMRHDRASVTRRMNEALEAAGENGDPAVIAAGIATLRRGEWRSQDRPGTDGARSRRGRAAPAVQRGRGPRVSRAG